MSESSIKPNVLKSKNDKRNTYTYELNNKLRVFIINDPDTDIACTGMLVKIGYFQDTIPGIAHFLEHMLFNGTENYPDEKTFSTFISKNNGTQNAYTAHDHTFYYFSIAQEALNEALKVFGDFFICPLLNKDSVNREKEAVNSEHIKNINDDNWRRQEIIRAASNNKHWFSKFGTGSNETLAVDDIDIKVKDFFNKYYSSHLMTLVVISKDKIENIKKIIDKIYSKIKIKNIDENDLKLNSKILKTPSSIKYIPIEDEHRLIFIWEVPFFKNTPFQSPLEFLAELLGNENKDSIHYILTENGYILDLSCYIREIVFSSCLFCINFELTPLGETKKKEITTLVMNYINKIKNNIGSQLFNDLYNERLTLIKYKFDNFEKSECIDTITEISTLYHTYNIDPTKILIMDKIQEKYSNDIKQKLENVLNTMTLDNLVIIIGSKKYKNIKYKNLIKNFPNYGTEYMIKGSVYNIDNIELIDDIKFPSLNSFISVSNKIFDIKNNDPILMSDTKDTSIKTYWMPNICFNTPDICIYITINIQMALKDVYTDTSVFLYLLTLSKELNHVIYSFKSALYSFSVNYSSGKIYIKVRGNYENIDKVLENYLKQFVNKEIISNDKFESAKYEIKKEDQNDIYKAPRDKVSDIFQKKIFEGYYNSEDRLKVIDNIDLKNTIEVFHTLLPHNNITLFVSGNCTENKFNNIQKLIKIIPHKKHDYSDYKNKLYRQIKNKEVYNIYNNNENEENNSTGYYIYIDTLDFTQNTFWIKPLCLLNLLNNIISNEYFDELRTKEMYGYIVKSKIVNFGEQSLNNFNYMFLVQSPNKTNKNITERTEKFIIDFLKQLTKMTDDDIETIKKGFITGILSEFNNLNELSEYIFDNEIETEYLKFNSREVIANFCKKITKKDLINFYEDKFINNNNKMVIQVSKQK